jgi:uncharacterized protein (UPF0332 family)
MPNAAQAALLSAGIPEDKLPKTHSGLIAAFGQHVVKTGKVESEFGRSLNKTEGFDYGQITRVWRSTGQQRRKH